MKVIKLKDKLQFKLILGLILMIFILAITISTVVFRQNYKMLVENTGTRALRVANIAASSIIVEDLLILNNPEDQGRPEYKKMYEILKKYKRHYGFRIYLYNEGKKWCL